MDKIFRTICNGLLAYAINTLKVCKYKRASQNVTLCRSKLWLYSSEVQKASEVDKNILCMKNSDGKMTTIRTNTINSQGKETWQVANLIVICTIW